MSNCDQHLLPFDKGDLYIVKSPIAIIPARDLKIISFSGRYRREVAPPVGSLVMYLYDIKAFSVFEPTESSDYSIFLYDEKEYAMPKFSMGTYLDKLNEHSLAKLKP